MWAGLLKDVERILNIGDAPFLIIEPDQLNFAMWNGGYGLFLRLKKDNIWHRKVYYELSKRKISASG